MRRRTSVLVVQQARSTKPRYHNVVQRNKDPCLVRIFTTRLWARPASPPHPVAPTDRRTVLMTRFAQLPLIDVCVCTFRRSSLASTLASIAAQVDIPGGMRVVVADNDDTPSAEALVAGVVSETGLEITYVHAPARNISIARNACLAAATAPYIAWIDDDEVADPDWLFQLFQAIGDNDAAFGRVIAQYPENAPPWVVRANLHSTVPVETVRGVITGYTSNALVRRSAMGGQQFAEHLGRSGGEDTDYFTRLHTNGSRFVAANAAIVREPTAEDRLSLSWLSRRSFRAGQTHARNYLQTGRRAEGILIAGSKALMCTAASGLLFFDNVRRRRLWVRAALHYGVVARLSGARDVELY